MNFDSLKMLHTNYLLANYIYIYILEHALSDIFVGFQERLFTFVNKPVFYKRYVDGTSVIFSSKSKSRPFFHTVNQLHQALTFSCEFGNNNNFPFLDVLIEQTNLGIHISINRKPMFTGSDTQCRSFYTRGRKINSIKTLVHWALMICSQSKLANEIDDITTTLQMNGYLEDMFHGTNVLRCKERSRSRLGYDGSGPPEPWQLPSTLPKSHYLFFLYRDFGEQIEYPRMFDVTSETRDITSVIILKSRLTFQVILPARTSLVTPSLIDDSARP